MRLADVVPLLLAEFSYPPGHPLAGGTGVVYGYAVVEDNDITIFDTGIGDEHPEIDPYYHPRRTEIRGAIERAGMDASRVTRIANSHLHFDHCGQNLRFAGRPICAQEREYEAAHASDYTVPEWVDFPGVDFRLHQGDVAISSRLLLISTPGHTPGHQSLLVSTDDGLIVLAGHGFNTAAEVARGGADATRSELERASAQRLLEFDPVRIYCGHDHAYWDRERGVVAMPPSTLATKVGRPRGRSSASAAG